MIVLPMVGKSSRFFNAGYTRPKYELPVGDRFLLDWVLQSFWRYFSVEPFLFLVRSDYGAAEFVRRRVQASGIQQFEIIVFDHETRGQAETVYLGVSGAPDDEPLYIFNIDTVHFSFSIHPMDELCQGYLEVFKGMGNHWSFIEPLSEYRVARTAEKQRISDLCSNGLYAFKNIAIFKEAFSIAEAQNATTNGEFYIAPIYNHLIEKGYPISYKIVDIEDLGFCGTPIEYKNFVSRCANFSFK